MRHRSSYHFELAETEGVRAILILATKRTFAGAFVGSESAHVFNAFR